MAIAGTLEYSTKIDKDGFNKGLKNIQDSVKSGGTKIKNIVSALGITKLVSTAISTINNSIDGAVSRIDTLNNFPKVMSNLGIASEDSSKAINKLSDGLQGIPTTLDDAALAVQRFTSKNGDVNKSVDLFLAVNNALLAGGASSEIQASAMEQLSQAYAKGKPDMMEWRSIQTAMPAQLKQISKAMLGNKDSLDSYLKKAKEYASANPLNSTAKELIEQLEEVKKGSSDMTTALGTALRSGVISMDEFMNTIIKMNQEGSGEFLSFEEQAKNSTGGIQTSISNAKTAIARGVANIITSFDEMLKSNGLGGISTVISNIGKIAENVLKKVASLIPKVVSKIKDIYNWTKKNQDLIKNLIKIIASLVVGYKAYKATLVAIKAINVAKNILGTVTAFLSLIPSIKSAEDAMILFNMTCSANPIGLVVAAVAALAAGLTFLVTKQTEEEKAAKNFAKSMADSRKEMEDFNKSIDDSMSADLSQIENVQKLKDELLTLVDANGKVKQGNETRASFILGELNKALDTEYSMTGNVINKYKELQTEIDKTIEKKKAEIILQSEEEKYKNALENRKQATEDLRNAQNKLTESLGLSYEEAKEKAIKTNELLQKYKDSNYNWVQTLLETGTSAKELWDALNNGAELNNLVKSVDDASARVKTYTEETKQYTEDQQLFLEGKYEKIGKIVGNSTKNWTDESLETIKNSIIEEKKALDDYTRIYQVFTDDVSKEQIEASKKSIENLTNALIAKRETIGGELGEEEKEAWKTLAENSYENYSMALANMDETPRKEIQEAIGIIAAGTPEMVAKADELGEKTAEEFDKSEEAKQNALNTITGYLNGLTDGEKRQLLQQIGIEDVDIVLDELNKGNLSEDHGRNILEGLCKGLKDKTWKKEILGVAAGLAKAVNKAFTGKDGWDIHSPSKKMKKFAEYYIQPISDVMNKRKKKITNTATDLVSSINKSIIDEMNKAVAIETSSINAKAILQANKEQPIVIARDQTINIDNKQVFEGKNQTPYEQQREAKQQLRRLAYGL